MHLDICRRNAASLPYWKCRLIEKTKQLPILNIKKTNVPTLRYIYF